MSMYFEEKGNRNAPTIVFIHGGGMSGWMWQKQWEAFSDFHCLIPDLPEHGKSANEGQITIEDSAERIAQFIKEHANGGRAHVVGHSLGGKIIVQLLATHPELIDHAVVASALFRPMPLMLSMMLNKPSYRLSLWMLKSKRMLEMQARQFNFPTDFYVQNYKKDAIAATVDSLDRIMQQMNKHTALPAGLDKAPVPTLVLAGTKEPKAMTASVGDIVKALPNAKGCMIRNAIHNYPWVQYEAFNEAVRAWLTGRPINNSSIIQI